MTEYRFHTGVHLTLLVGETFPTDYCDFDTSDADY